MPNVKGFLPSKNGLHYANNFNHCRDIPLEIDILGIHVKIGKVSNGMCGGMVYYVRDLFVAGLNPPPDTIGPCNGPQFDYLCKRLFDSFNLPDGPLNYLALMDPHIPDCDLPYSNIFSATLLRSRAWIMVNREWPKIKNDIDRNRLASIGLILEKSPTSPSDIYLLARQHHVMSYGYELVGHDLSMKIYDPNHANHDHVTISLDLNESTKTSPVFLSCADCGRKIPVYCFFKTKYRYQKPKIHG